MREVAGDPLRTAPQSNTPQPVQGNAPTQSVNFSGGLAEAVDAGVAEEVPASVNLTRRAFVRWDAGMVGQRWCNFVRRNLEK